MSDAASATAGDNKSAAAAAAATARRFFWSGNWVHSLRRDATLQRQIDPDTVGRWPSSRPSPTRFPAAAVRAFPLLAALPACLPDCLLVRSSRSSAPLT